MITHLADEWRERRLARAPRQSTLLTETLRKKYSYARILVYGLYVLQCDYTDLCSYRGLQRAINISHVQQCRKICIWQGREWQRNRH